jgi:hypothetical protein
MFAAKQGCNQVNQDTDCNAEQKCRHGAALYTLAA